MQPDWFFIRLNAHLFRMLLLTWQNWRLSEEKRIHPAAAARACGPLTVIAQRRSYITVNKVSEILDAICVP